MFKKYRCYCPSLQQNFVSINVTFFLSINVTFFYTTPFSLSSTVTSQEEDDYLLVYTISSPVPIPTPTLIPIKPPITQVYSQRQNPPISSPTLATLSSDQVHNYDLTITLHKGKR